MHYLCALVAFLTLAGFSRFLFTKSKCPSIKQGSPKAKRNKVYTWCAYVMILCIFSIGIWSVLHASWSWSLRILFLVLALLLMVGLSWLCFKDYCFRGNKLAVLLQCRTWCQLIAHAIILVLLVLGVVGVWKILGSSFPFVFAAETVLLMAFGISWFVKGGNPVER